MQVYASMQVKNLLKFIPKKAMDWFIVGGPADGDEAQVVRAERPNACILGCEPNPFMYNIQTARGFPGRLMPYALWDSSTTLTMLRVDHVDNEAQSHRSSAIAKFKSGTVSYSWAVFAETLDNLSRLYGPFTNVALWLDIEGSELKALQGAQGLLNNHQIRWLNVELFAENAQPVHQFLVANGFTEKLRWNGQGAGGADRWDAVYTL